MWMSRIGGEFISFNSLWVYLSDKSMVEWMNEIAGFITCLLASGVFDVLTLNLREGKWI
jgi:hypothetical protein